MFNGSFSFAKNMGKNISKTKSKNLSGKNSQKLLDHVKQSGTDILKTASKRAIPKTASSGLIGIKIADRITKSQKYPNRIIQK